MSLTLSVILLGVSAGLIVLFRQLDLRGIERWWTGSFFVGSIMVPIIVASITLGAIGLIAGTIFSPASPTDAIYATIIAVTSVSGLWLLNRRLKSGLASAPPVSPDHTPTSTAASSRPAKLPRAA